MFNYITIAPNDLYTEIYDIIVDEELLMANIKHRDDIEKIITKAIRRNKNIKLSKNVETSEELLENAVKDIYTDNLKQYYSEGDNIHFDTFAVYGDMNYYYEIMYCENHYHNPQITENDDISNKLSNQYANILNPEKIPIYGNIIIIKNKFIDNKVVNDEIKLDDVANILIHFYYHKGVMINENGELTEITFSGNKPEELIGYKFEPIETKLIVEMLGIKIFGHIEKSDKVNATASAIFNTEIKGKVFLCTSCPIVHTVYWNITKEAVELMYKLIKKNVKLGDYNEDVRNPYFALKLLDA